MTDNSRVRNLAIILALAIAYTVPAIFLSPQNMLDIVSVPMLVFGLWGIYIVFGETWGAFWAGEQSKTALGLFSLFALLLSVVIMRPYGIATRNVAGAEDYLSTTHILPIALTIQALGLYLFTRASAAPYVPSKRTGWGQLIAGILIGALVASSRILEPGLLFVSKMFSRIF